MTSTTVRVLPSRELRDALIDVEFAADPRPPACAEHPNPKRTRNTCVRCHAIACWRMRTLKRFHKRGLILSLDDRAYMPPGDTEPPPCPDGHGDPPVAARDGCPACRKLHNWRERNYRRMRQAGTVATDTVDVDALRHHVKLLRDGGMPVTAIAHAAECGISTIQRLLRDSTDRAGMRADLAQRILAVPIPEHRFTLVRDASGAVHARVDATGTHRRIQAACRAGHGIPAQGRMLGYARTAVWFWLSSQTVPVAVAVAVARLYPRLIARPGDDLAAATKATRKGWAPARYYSDVNIDDPAYRPYAILKNPVGVYRRLRAMAWDGNGPRQVAPHIGETVKTVTDWLRGKPAPAYAAQLLAAAMEELPAPGPDAAIAARARRARWAPPLAWHDRDIDNAAVRPHIDVTTQFRKTDHPLYSQVFQGILGLIPADDLVRAERISVVRALHRAGWGDRRIAVWMRWSDDPEDGMDAVCQFRIRWEITGGGIAVNRSGGIRADDDHIVAPAA